ncbi:hypothetical protein D8B26_001505 [Coccidioides posadasii str. Silveira]|uniref:Kinesin-2 85 kDa subunit n=2 Tax=Coccidioides posadasii TaxID=199306 RepID=E9CVG1_COCPS|nr:kinesin, putative [Coccidioides posadasii C735 delta SOWgp]EER23402.1 kinesin, putative [Coccidioides posadasii C735 delta SOWgp]EFW21287.1 kinesin-2 85 kDa subunit [Coccidioides posadasii str. Silveira]QVM06800.1 hypothetical protein D8B26_001505 [Coccidioides posadasii str. Silveira]|eukprot:XP_003065547.1 kinesin, putative [Coccidioides posadasii C735 delta SOWgp]
MSVRVVARIRPLLKTEREIDIILRPGASNQTLPSAAKSSDENTTLKKQKDIYDRPNVVRIPNPKNEGEQYSFQFNSVYDDTVGQQEFFDAEVAPTVKHLFNGFDITLFAYGVTGTGKTHTMRGGKSLADRGVIPRLLSGIYRRSRKMEKDSQGATKVNVVMSYYEIYNDKVFDLFEPPEKRTPSGLPLRDSGGKTIVVGLTERPCGSLKEFECLYDQANINRSTSATKLNAHSSRSHAILCVKLTVTTGDRVRVSTASAIDLAGSEDNRRTDNGKERMVESASINKSLFVLAQCVEAISKKQARIPYRESKMTRILSLGQNQGLTVMILNLAPVRSYHLDTLSSLNFANRTKKIEVREVENEPMFKGPPRLAPGLSAKGSSIKRQPLRPLTASLNANIVPPAANGASKPSDGKPTKSFMVYTDKSQAKQQAQPALAKASPLKRKSGNNLLPLARPSKIARVANEASTRCTQESNSVSAAKIEEMVEKKVAQILAARARDEAETSRGALRTQANNINAQLQRRLERLEQRVEGNEDARAEGLSYLLMGKQHQSHGEDKSALKMYQLALPFFPENAKLAQKIEVLQARLNGHDTTHSDSEKAQQQGHKNRRRVNRESAEKYDSGDEEYCELEENDSLSDENYEAQGHSRPKPKASKAATRRCHPRTKETGVVDANNAIQSPRTAHILSIINSRNINQIKLLRGVGAKKAEAIVDCLCEMDGNVSDADKSVQIRSLVELGKMKGVGLKTVENMRNAVDVA